MQFFSQYGQDQYLDEYVFNHKIGGVFWEAGAGDGCRLSNTCFFEKYRGWTGVCVEPRKGVFKELVASRVCKTVNCCLAASSGERDFLLVKGYGSDMSGLADMYTKDHFSRVQANIKKGKAKSEVVKVQCRTIMDVLSECGFNHLDLCSIDLNGGSFEVIGAIDFSLVSVNVFLVENQYGDKKGLRSWMKERGYVFVHRCEIDDVFVKTGVIY